MPIQSTRTLCRGLTLLCLFGMLSQAVIAGDDWPQFRGPTGEGHSDAKGLPVTWSETENVTWKTALPGKGWSSPVVLGNQIWMTTAEDEGKSLRALCVNRETGELIYNLELFQLAETPEKHATNSHASPTPVLETKRAYIHFGTYGTACIDTENGKTLWTNNELKLDHEVGPGTSPMLYGDLLLINCDGIDNRFVVALHKQSGDIVWRTDRSGEPNASPSMRKAFATPLVIDVGGKSQAVSPGADRVIAYDPLTGAENWIVRYNGFSNVPRPVYGNGLVFVCTGYMKPQLWAIRVDGNGDVTDSHVAWKVTKQVPAKPSPILMGAELYIVSDDGIATCLDAATGEEIWKQRLSGPFSASPVDAEGRIYFGNEKGEMTVIQAGREYKELATNKLDAGFKASPAIAGNAFYLRTITHLYRIEAK